MIGTKLKVEGLTALDHKQKNSAYTTLHIILPISNVILTTLHIILPTSNIILPIWHINLPISNISLPTLNIFLAHTKIMVKVMHDHLDFKIPIIKWKSNHPMTSTSFLSLE